jgi:hypothetical protein
MSGRLELAQWPYGTRTALEIGIGTVIGTGLTAAAFGELKQLWRPALLITVALVLTGLVVGLWSSRLLGINPVIAVLGAESSGKTTLVVKLIPELVRRGVSVSTIKHAHHAFDVDQPGKDSFEHRRAGGLGSRRGRPRAVVAHARNLPPPPPKRLTEPRVQRAIRA